MDICKQGILPCTTIPLSKVIMDTFHTSSSLLLPPPFITLYPNDKSYIHLLSFDYYLSIYMIVFIKTKGKAKKGSSNDLFQIELKSSVQGIIASNTLIVYQSLILVDG